MARDVALDLELAEVRAVGEADRRRAPRSLVASNATATFQPSRSSMRRAGGQRARAPSGCARSRSAPGDRNSRLTSAAPPRRGRRRASSRPRASIRLPSSEIVMRAPSFASAAGTHAIPITPPSCGEKRALVTWPIGPAVSGITTAPSVGTWPFSSVKPTSAVSSSSLCDVLERPLADEVLLLVELHDPGHRGAERRATRSPCPGRSGCASSGGAAAAAARVRTASCRARGRRPSARPRGARRARTGSGSRSPPRPRSRSAGSGSGTPATSACLPSR